MPVGSQLPESILMGRGDKRTKKGKRFAGSYGNSRPNPGEIRRRKDKQQAEAEAESKSEQQQVASCCIVSRRFFPAPLSFTSFLLHSP